jgi:hypothetical protein
MKTISNMSSKYGLSLAAALALSIAAAGLARVNPVPTTTDEVRALAAAPISQPTGATFPLNDAVFSTDDARELAGRPAPVSSEGSAASAFVTSTDEARAVCAVTPC